jgi:hypothetical protein
LATHPIQLAFGQSFTFGAAFRPERVGLQRGLVEIVSNDPSRRVMRVSAVGTGLPDLVYPHWGKNFVAIETPGIPGSVTLRVLSDDKGHFDLFLPPEQRYHVAVFDVQTGLIGHFEGISARSSEITDPTGSMIFGASTAPDTIGNGLPDDIKFAIGTDPHKTDTCGQGIDDFTALFEGLDVLGNCLLPTGVIAGLSLQGEANDVVLQGDPLNAKRQTAYVATGSYGLAIVDASQFNKPIVSSQLKLPGTATSLAVDPTLQIAAVATNNGGLQLIDVADPMQPRLLRVINIPTAHVAVADGIAYIPVGSSLRAYDLLSGGLLQTLSLPGGQPIKGLAREGNMLYTMDSGDTLRAVEFSGFEMRARGSLHLPRGGGRLFVGNGIAYVPAADNFQGGFSTVNVADPDHLTLIAGPQVPSGQGAPNTAMVANGSGLALLAGSVPRAGNLVYLMNTTDLANTNNFVSRFSLAAPAQSVAIASGIGYIANGTAGLQVINYIPLDTRGIPPTAVLTTTAASSVLEGAPVAIRADVRDDVQVRTVELLVNGLVVRNDVSFPFELSVVAPKITPQSHTLTVQIRATDTGGNATLSNTLTFDVVRDTSPPTVAATVPAASGTGIQTQAISVYLSKDIDVSQLNLRGLRVSNIGTGTEVSLSSVQVISDRRFTFFTQTPLVSGMFRVTIDPSIIVDKAGNHLAAPHSFTFTNYFVDPNSNAWISTHDGNWNDAANWSSGRVPGAADDDVIDPLGATVTVTLTGSSTIKSLHTKQAFVMAGGTLVVSQPSEASAALTLRSFATLRANGPEALFLATGPTTLAGVSLVANNGGSITLPALTNYNSNLGTHFQATGSGSVIDLSNLTSLTASQSATFTVDAQNGGKINLVQVDTMVGNVRVTANGNDSDVDLSSVTSFTNPVNSSNGALVTVNGGRVRMPGITSLDKIDLTVGGTMDTSQLTAISNATITLNTAADLGGLTTIDGDGLIVNNGVTFRPPGTTYTQSSRSSRRILRAGAGSVLDLSNLTRIVAGTVTGSTLSIEATAGGATPGGHVPLGRTTNITGPVQITASGNGSEIDLSALTNFVNTDTRGAGLTTSGGGRIRMAALTSPDGVNLTVGGMMDVSQLTAVHNGQITISGASPEFPHLSNLDGSGLIVNDNAVVTLPLVVTYTQGDRSFDSHVFRANRAGSQINLPNLRSLTGSTNGIELLVEARSGGQVNMAMVASITGPVQVTAEGMTSLVDLSMMTSFVHSSRGTAALVTRSGGHLRMGRLTSIDNIDLTVGGDMDTAQLTAVRNATIRIEGVPAEWTSLTSVDGSSIIVGGGVAHTFPGIVNYTLSAGSSVGRSLEADNGSVLNLPNLMRVTGSLDTSAQLTVQGGTSGGTSSGHVLLPAATSFSGPIQVVATSANSLVDVGALTSFTNTNPRARAGLATHNGGQVDMGRLTSLENIDLTVGGIMQTSQLTLIHNATIRLKGRSAEFTNLRSLDDDSVIVTRGATQRFPDFITSYAMSAGNSVSRSLRADTNSVLDLSHITRVTGSPDTFAELTVQGGTFGSTSGGQVLLPAAISLSGPVQVVAWSANGLVDVGALTSFTNTNPRARAGLATHNGGRVNMGRLTSLENIDLTVGGTMDTRQLTLIHNATISIEGVEAHFDALRSLDDDSVIVTGGVTQGFPDQINSYAMSAGNSVSRSLEADGNNSRLDLSHITRVTGSPDTFAELTVQGGTFGGTSGGQVLLPAAISFSGPIQVVARSDNSVVDLSGLTNFTNSGTSGRAALETVQGGRIRMAGLTTLDHIDLTVGGVMDTSQLTAIRNANITVNGVAADLSSVNSIDGSGLTVNGGGVAALPRVTTLANTNFRLFTANTRSRIDLSGLTSITGPVDFQARGDNSEIDLSMLSNFVNNAPGAGGLETFSGGRIRMGRLTSLTNLNLTVGGPMDTAQLTAVRNGTITINGVAADLSRVASIDRSSVIVTGGVTVALPLVTSYTYGDQFSPNRSFQASGAGSVLDLSNLTTVTGSQTSSVVLSITADSGARIPLTRLTSITGPARVAANGTASDVDLSALTSFVDTNPRNPGALATTAGGRIRMGRLTSLNNIDLTVGGPMDINQLTAVRNGNVSFNGVAANLPNLAHVDGSGIAVSGGVMVSLPAITAYSIAGTTVDRALRATGVGSMLDLTHVTTVTGSVSPAPFDDDGVTDLMIEARSGGVVDLRQTTAIPDGVVHIRADGDQSVVNLSVMLSIGNSHPFANSSFEAVNNGTIQIPGLPATLDRIDLTFGRGGVITNVDTSRITSFTNATLRVLDQARDFSRLSNITGSGLEVSGGVTLALPLLTSYTNAAGRVDRAWRASGSGSLLDLSSVTTVTGSANPPLNPRDTDGSTELLIEAASGGVVDLRRTSSFPGGVVRARADGANSIVNLSALTSITSTHAFANSGLEAVNNGTVQTGALPAMLNRIDLSYGTGGVITGVNTSQVTAFTNATLRISEQARDFSRLANIDGSGVEVSGGVTLALPLVTSYTNTAPPAARALRATGENSVLDLSNITTITGNATQSSILLIDAQSGGKVDLHRTTAMSVPAGAVAGRAIQATAGGFGSLVDLSSLTSFSDDSAEPISRLTASNTGVLKLTSGTVVLEHIDVVLQFSGKLMAGTPLMAGTLDVSNGSVLRGSGTIVGNVINRSRVEPGNPFSSSPGTLNIEGDYTQTAAGVLNIKIGGLNPASFDQLIVTGRATLDGTLRIAVVNNFVPNVGNTFKIMTFGSRTGTFATFLGLNIRPGVVFTPGFNDMDLTLTVNNG